MKPHETKKDVINYFGGLCAFAKFLGIRTQAISQWGNKIPYGRAYQIESLTKGKFKAQELIKIWQKNSKSSSSSAKKNAAPPLR